MGEVATAQPGTGYVHLARVVRDGGSVSVRLPASVRKRLGLLPGDLLGARVFNNLLVMERLPTEGIAKPKDLPASILPPQLRGQGA